MVGVQVDTCSVSYATEDQRFTGGNLKQFKTEKKKTEGDKDSFFIKANVNMQGIPYILLMSKPLLSTHLHRADGLLALSVKPDGGAKAACKIDVRGCTIRSGMWGCQPESLSAKHRDDFRSTLHIFTAECFQKGLQFPLSLVATAKSSFIYRAVCKLSITRCEQIYELSAAAGGQQKERRRRPTPCVLIAHRPFLRLVVLICLGIAIMGVPRGTARRRAGGHPNRLNWIPRFSGRVPAAGPTDYSGYL
jgi:hypothetical protein